MILGFGGDRIFNYRILSIYMFRIICYGLGFVGLDGFSSIYYKMKMVYLGWSLSIVVVFVSVRIRYFRVLCYLL